jgi:hypothetical protein
LRALPVTANDTSREHTLPMSEYQYYEFQAIDRPLDAAAAGAAFIDLEAAKADEVSPLPTAPSIRASTPRTIASTTAFGCPVLVATPSIKSPRSTRASCY